MTKWPAATINQEIDRLRLAATSNLMSRKDVIIVASVSCIYGLGSPEEYQEMYVHLGKGDSIERNKLLRSLPNDCFAKIPFAISREIVFPKAQAGNFLFFA